MPYALWNGSAIQCSRTVGASTRCASTFRHCPVYRNFNNVNQPRPLARSIVSRVEELARPKVVLAEGELQFDHRSRRNAYVQNSRADRGIKRCSLYSIWIFEAIVCVHVAGCQGSPVGACNGCAAKRDLSLRRLGRIRIHCRQRHEVPLARRRSVETPESGRLFIAIVMHIRCGEFGAK